MIIHNDRTPYRATGRHGSRVQRANHLQRLGWEYDKQAWHNWQQARAALGICPHSGETFEVCKGSDLCDCFDYPEHEHYRTDPKSGLAEA